MPYRKPKVVPHIETTANHPAAVPAAQPHRESLRLRAGFVVAVSVAIWMVTHRFNLVIHGDDAMRMLQVRDLLDGQAWNDLTQHRLRLDDGWSMHLSRLIDAPIAALILLFELFFTRAQAETLAMIVWPGAMFGLTVACLHLLCHRLGGPHGAVYGTILASILLAQSGQYDPGSMTRQNFEIALLALAIVGFIMRRPRWPFALVGGIAAALGIVIGGGLILHIAAVCVSFAVAWAMRGTPERPYMLIFALSFAVVLCLALVVGPPADVFNGNFCNAISINLVLPALLGAIGLSGLAYFMSDFTQTPRVLAVGMLAISVSSLTAILGDFCLSDSLTNLDPLFVESWSGRVEEYRSIADFSSRDFWSVFGCFVGWLISLWFVAYDIRRDPWMLLCALLALSLLLTVYLARPLPVTSMLSVLPSSVLASRIIMRKNANTNIWSSVASLSILLLSVPFLTSTVAAMQEASVEMRGHNSARVTKPLPASGVACSSERALRGLKRLSPGMVMAPDGMGPHILLHTPHRILSAPLQQEIFGSCEQTATSDKESAACAGDPLAAASVDYIVRCNDDPEFAAGNPALASQLRKGAADGSLEFIPKHSSRSLTIYRVRPL